MGFLRSPPLLCLRKALTAAAHVVHGEAERLVEERARSLSFHITQNECLSSGILGAIFQ